MITSLLAAARYLPERLQSAELTLRSVADAVSDTKHNLTRLAQRLADERSVPRQAFVYLLPPEGPIFCQSALVGGGLPVTQIRGSNILAPGVRVRLTFTSHIDMPAGIWIVVAGPVVVRGVRIGNQSQDFMTDFNGHVCKTRDAWPLGCQLGVELEAAPG